MNQRDLARLMKKAEKQVPIEARVQDRLLRLGHRIEAIQQALEKKEDWIEIRRLARHGKRIASRFKDNPSRKYFGVLFNTVSTYLGLPGDRDQRVEAYRLA